MLLTFLAIGIALFFAMNIGASGAAASMGAVYGAGAIRNKLVALLLVALAVFLGAVLGSGEVVKTIGSGIIPTDILDVPIVLIILVGATSTLFIANLLGIPLSTSEVTVGSIVGIGIAFQALYVSNLLYIVSFWILIPVAAFGVAYGLGKGVLWLEKRYPELKKGGKWRKGLVVLLILTGCLEAFSAGMNNVANAIGPLVGAGLLGTTEAIWLGGAFVALGAVLLGGRVLETNGKRITSLSLLQGSIVSGTGGTLVVIASLLGIPVPLTQATTSAIVGVGTAENGFRLWQKNVIVQIIKVWVVSPILSLVVAYTLVHLILDPNPYVIIVLISVFVGTFGTLSLLKTIRQDKKSVHEQGGEV
ncbi:phosphate transporter [Caldalkalibacillus thermarum TA2.A1]|uniref:Phosphate transporter n=1 Tax=Caldalkalibacillus thermarum (strain TA2.A1) TaxID=986075 RepID=F5L7B8_CALTT|nr:inorganic phosphate transporter [Caldalkalibacillus thermarum]EGL82779.1 phosphate transporter [Caldalkalibacillus thermarum TA2.A1]QZT33924.1 inorganic phosphate transporter family protein [Caldalkalibacillus thermarum TA2.A1]